MSNEAAKHTRMLDTPIDDEGNAIDHSCKVRSVDPKFRKHLQGKLSRLNAEEKAH